MGGIIIAGSSGIFKPNDYPKGHYERQPYSPSDLRSIYHTRQYDITKLALLHRPDVFLSHDWPNKIEQYGDLEMLLRRKPFFQQEIETSTLGSPPLQTLLAELRPRRWFSAHLHVRYYAKVDFTLLQHTMSTLSGPNPTSSAIHATKSSNPEALAIGDDSDDNQEDKVKISADDSHAGPLITEFLALGKCVPKSEYLEFLDISSPVDDMLHGVSGTERPELPFNFDLRWLAITKIMHPFLSLTHQQKALPHPQDLTIRQRVEMEQEQLRTKLQEGKGALSIRNIQRFVHTAPTQANVQSSEEPCTSDFSHNTAPIYVNPQTTAFCELIQIPNLINAPQDASGLKTERKGSSHDHVLYTTQQIKRNTSTAGKGQEELDNIRKIALDRKRKRQASKGV